MDKRSVQGFVAVHNRGMTRVHILVTTSNSSYARDLVLILFEMWYRDTNSYTGVLTGYRSHKLEISISFG